MSVDTVTINEDPNEEMTLEAQAELQDSQNQSSSNERPEWLDEKFQSPEDLQEAYNQLQTKLGESNQNETVEENPPTPETTQSSGVITDASNEFYENGELSEATYGKLAESGIPKEYVDAYIAGRAAITDASQSEIQQTVGGEESYNAMAQWAGESLSDEELSAYNSIVESGTVEQAKMAVNGLYARYKESGGTSPQLTQGRTTGGNVAPFNSAAQVTAAMRDGRYESDPAYRAEVEKRLSVSDIF